MYQNIDLETLPMEAIASVIAEGFDDLNCYSHRSDSYWEYMMTPTYQAAEKVINSINGSKNYRIGYLDIRSDKGFGFLDVDDVYVNGNYLHTNLNNFANTLVMVKVGSGPKGLRANKVVKFSAEGCKELMKDYFSKFCKLAYSSYMEVYKAEEAKAKAREQEAAKRAAEKAAKEAAIVAKYGHYSIQNEHQSSNYGGWYEADFIFEEPISEERFISFLQEKGHKTVAAPCYVPIVPESVTFHTYNGGRIWSYAWRGEWDD